VVARPRLRIGETITDWGVVTPEACAFVGIAAEYVHLDSFFGMTFQLRARGLRTRLVHHVRLFDPRAADDWLQKIRRGFTSPISPRWGRRSVASRPRPCRTWTITVACGHSSGVVAPRRGSVRATDAAKRIEDLTRFAARAGMDPFTIAGWQERFARWEPVAVPA